jgi:transcriptional regulator with GAF, ATPase, and Fis domain
MSELLSLTSAHDFDVTEALTRLTRVCATFAGAAVAGVLFLQRDGSLRAVAMSQDGGPIAALFATGEPGPCEDALRQGEVLAFPDVAAQRHRWPEFARKATAAGVRAVHALPMRRDQTPIGCLKLLYQQPTILDPPAVRALQAFAEVASVALLVRERGDTVEQLEAAIRSRASSNRQRESCPPAGWAPRTHRSTPSGGTPATTTCGVVVVAQGLVSGTLPAAEVLAERKR